MHIYVTSLEHHWFWWWLLAWPVPSHYLNQCWNIVNWTLGNNLQWNLNQNLFIFIQKNAFEYVIWKTAAILSLPQCVNNHQWRYLSLMEIVWDTKSCTNDFMLLSSFCRPFAIVETYFIAGEKVSTECLNVGNCFKGRYGTYNGNFFHIYSRVVIFGYVMYLWKTSNFSMGHFSE